ncbi:glycosyltransferase family 2 protein [Geomonas subterranea]|uniref:Glycosyltransferase family 2 protein n=2 Tax=Geomonas subterranea TaxID=2847989 RepID=A0ABX8LN09_9BACT|nr:glycosyltransferase family 2 protein [Geomonas subterranea]QXE92322.1 glycosyltransferase family 2 protein [Geomonas subterranea]
MTTWQMRSPVAFFIFNRPDTTARVFEAIRKAAPPTLLVIADGPRSDREGEAEKCAAARAIASNVDWPCQVLLNFSDVNLGCKRRISSGMDWVFGTVGEAVILEDDCVPEPTFFRFCDELLEKFRDDDRVAMISGNNFHGDSAEITESYYFSRRPHIWGWATWRRSWRRYDVEMKSWPAVKKSGWLKQLFPQRAVARYWRVLFDAVHRGDIDTWDHQFTYCCFLHDTLCVMPAVNLVSNIGFGEEATHTKAVTEHAGLPTRAMAFPLLHPCEMKRNVLLDSQLEESIHMPLRQALLLGRTAARLRRLLRREPR